MIPEFEYEPIRGLPYDLPEGERILWQGSPRWLTLAKHLCHTRFVTAYFLALIGYAIYAANADGVDPSATFKAVAWLSAMMGVVVGLICAFAYTVSRTTIYTITNRRVVLRYGVAINKAVNVPFKIVAGVGLRAYPDGSGDITLQLTGPDKLAYLLLWPHARPWYFTLPQPMMRGVQDAGTAVEVLRQVMGASAPEVQAVTASSGKGDMRGAIGSQGQKPLAA